MGRRDDEERPSAGTGITVWDLAAGRLRENGVDGSWVHLDAVMPAVDSRQPGGLGEAELVEALRVLPRSGLTVSIDVTIHDPDGDPTGEIAEGLVPTLEKVFEEDV